MCKIRLPLIAILCGLLPSLSLAEDANIKRVAAIVTVYRHNAHADVIVGRLLESQTLDGKGEQLPLKVVSMYVDQKGANDMSADLAKKHGFTVYDTITGALTLGTGKLAVDGVVMVAEHGQYPDSETGQTIYPKRRFFNEIVKVFRDSGRGVPLFSDKHLADNWTDAKWIYDASKELKFPMMAGSSLPPTWRVPEIDIKKGAKVKQLVGLSYGSLDAYGFHTLEMMQCLAERREGGETGVKSVQAYRGEAVWKAGEDGVYDPELLKLALTHVHQIPIPKNKTLKELVKDPVCFVIDHPDGYRSVFFMLNGAVSDFASAWKYDDGKLESAEFRCHEERPFMHFATLTKGINRLMHDNRAPWPVERTLYSSAILDAGMISLKRNGEKVDTSYLLIPYTCDWEWKAPPPIPAKP